MNEFQKKVNSLLNSWYQPQALKNMSERIFRDKKGKA
jgi:hypothetical protein